MDNFILKGDIVFSKSMTELEISESSFAVCENGICKGVFKTIPEKFSYFPVKDHTGCLIIPGLTDIHLHAPQFPFCGTGTDLELLEWLERCAFPEEEKYSDEAYAQKAYSAFVSEMIKSGITRACIFATVHTKATEMLMDMLDKTGLVTFVGKVSMDRNSPQSLTEKNTDDLKNMLCNIQGKYKNTFPIITPRFIPSCTDEMLDSLCEIRRSYSLPVQSHLSENPSEKELVSKLVPDSDFYGQAYDMHSLFGFEIKTGERFKTIMAHCVYSDDEEIKLMSKNGVIAAHCPASNINLRSGIAPVRKLLQSGVPVGLGSDIGAGHTLSPFRAVTDAVQVSKLYQRLKDHDARPLTFAEAFYLSTHAGGFFGNIGKFCDGYMFDALVLDDSASRPLYPMTAAERLERYAYLFTDNKGIKEKYVNGKAVYLQNSV